MAKKTDSVPRAGNARPGQLTPPTRPRWLGTVVRNRTEILALVLIEARVIAAAARVAREEPPGQAAERAAYRDAHPLYTGRPRTCTGCRVSQPADRQHFGTAGAARLDNYCRGCRRKERHRAYNERKRMACQRRTGRGDCHDGTRDFSPPPPKPCAGCGVVLTRRVYAGGRPEKWTDFAERRHCSRACVGAAARARRATG